MSASPVKNQIRGIYVSCEDSKRAREWYTNVLGLSSFEMEQDHLDLMLMNWGENHKPIDGPAIFSFYAPDIHKAFEELKSKGANIVGEIGSYGPSLGFHVKDSEGNSILIFNG